MWTSRLNAPRHGILRWAGYLAVTVCTLGMMVWGAERSLERTERAQRDARIMALAGPPHSGTKEIQISVKSLDVANSVIGAGDMDLRIGIAYDNRIAYWAHPIDVQSCSVRSDADPFETFVRSRRDGEVILAVGPITRTEKLAVPEDARSTRGPIVLIDGVPYSVVERKSVENLIELSHLGPKLAAFDERASGVRGEVELSYAL